MSSHFNSLLFERPLKGLIVLAVFIANGELDDFETVVALQELQEGHGYGESGIAEGSTAPGAQDEHLIAFGCSYIEHLLEAASDDVLVVAGEGGISKALGRCTGDDIDVKPLFGWEHVGLGFVALEDQNIWGIDQVVIAHGSHALLMEGFDMRLVEGLVAGLQTGVER